MSMDGFKRESMKGCPRCHSLGLFAEYVGEDIVYRPCYACGGSGIIPTANPETTTESESIYSNALELWGFDAQVKMAVEEMAELIKVLMKLERNFNGSTYKEIAEEIADVEIMMEQMRLIFGCFVVDNAKREKLLKLGLLIAKAKGL